MFLSAALSIAVIIYMLIKKMDIKVTLFIIGIALMFVAMIGGNGIAI